MKVTLQSEPKFIPVVITLETQEEVDILFDLVGHVIGCGITREFTDSMWGMMNKLSTCPDGKHFKGQVATKS